MATNWTGSDFEIDQLGIKFEGESAYETVKCIGSVEETMDAKVVTKKCRGVVAKTRVKGTGAGTLKISAHIPWAIYVKAYGMELDSLIEGVKAYGKNSIHKVMSIVAHVLDEDNNEKLKAYPNCIISSGGVSRKTENGAEEVAEIELEISVMPDDHGNGLYETVVDELTDETVKTTWMTAFTPDMVQVASA